MVACLHSRDAPGFPSKHNDPLSNTLRTAVQVGLGAYQVVAEAPQKGTREHNRHLISPAHSATYQHTGQYVGVLLSRLHLQTTHIHMHNHIQAHTCNNTRADTCASTSTHVVSVQD